MELFDRNNKSQMSIFLIPILSNSLKGFQVRYIGPVIIFKSGDLKTSRCEEGEVTRRFVYRFLYLLFLPSMKSLRKN